MGLVWKTTAMAVTAFGAVFFSQAPEFAQQYRQRIGGAIDELRIIVVDFETQASESGLDRERALDLFARSTEGFLQDRGLAMRRTFERFETLSAQRAALDQASAVLQPVLLARNPDTILFANTWKDFVPALPISFPGLIWALAGGVASALLATLCRLMFRRKRPAAPARPTAPVAPTVSAATRQGAIETHIAPAPVVGNGTEPLHDKSISHLS